MANKACFCRRARFRLRMTGMGRMMMAKSVTMLMAALVNHIANWSIHVACSLVQNARTGTQAKILPNTVQIVYAITTAIMHQEATLNFGLVKIR